MKYNKNEIFLDQFNESYISEKYLSWLNNKELMQYSENRHTNHTIDSCREYYQSFKNSNNLLFAILDKKNMNHVGNISAYIDTNNLTADIGILVGVTGQGYGFLAWEAFMKKLFSEYNIRKITGGTMDVNKAMKKIFIKSGMDYEYSKKDHCVYKERYVDMVGYCAFNPEIVMPNKSRK